MWARSTPSLASGLLPIGAWALFLAGRCPSAPTLIIVSTLGAARWFAWTTASLVVAAAVGAGLDPPDGRDDRRGRVLAPHVPGVDISAGTAPAPPAAERTPLRRLRPARLRRGARGRHGRRRATSTSPCDRGELVLVVGPVGAGKSSLLRALAGIVHHTGELRWNGEPVARAGAVPAAQPGRLRRPAAAGAVRHGRREHPARARRRRAAAVSTAQLEHDLGC